jgi:hypothetical protein
MIFLIVAFILLVVAYLLPDRGRLNDILAVAGVICGVLGIIMLFSGTMVVTPID